MSKKKSKLASLILIVIIVVNLVPVTLIESGFKIKKAYADPTGISDGLTATNTALANVYNSITKFFESESFFNDLLEAALKEVAKAALREMTTSTVNWINSGFEGRPLYFENPKSFYLGIRDQQVQTFIDEIGYDSIKYPFGQEYAMGLIDSVSRNFEDNARYSLNEAIEATHPGSTAEDFYEDFEVGGWDAFLSMSTIPSNNPIGFQYEAQKEIDERTFGTKQSEAEILKEKVNQGQGFLSPQDCTAEGYVGPAENPWLYPPYIPPIDSDTIYDETYDTYYDMYIEFSGPEYEGTDDYISEQTVHDNAVAQATAAANAAEAENGDAQIQYIEDKTADLEAYNTAHTCPEDKWVDRTPGYVVADQITSALGSNWTQSELGAAVGSSLSAVFDALFNELFDKGLSVLSDGTEAVTENLWNYQGLTIGGSESDDTVVGGSTWLGTADIVVDLQAKLIDGDAVDGKTDIERTSEEVALLRQTLNQTQLLPEKMEVLDKCVPGMDYDWKKRADKAFDREVQKLVRKASGNDGLFGDPDKADAVLKTIEADYSSAKLKMQLRLIDSNIPSAQAMTDNIASLTNTKYKSTTYFDFLIEKSSTLARLNSLREKLLAGVSEEELVSQYLALEGKISTLSTIQSAQLDLDIVNDTLQELDDQLSQCISEKNNLVTTNPTLYSALTGPGVFIDLSGLLTYVPEFLTAEQDYYCQNFLSEVNQNDGYLLVDVALSCNDFFFGSATDYYIDYTY